MPLTLISQYLPLQYAAIRDGRLNNDPRELVLDGVANVLRHYADACHPALPELRAVNG
jgi:D-tagatose-1,6-bisphosphate aldolase subunit GatZ/KbaZ